MRFLLVFSRRPGRQASRLSDFSGNSPALQIGIAFVVSAAEINIKHIRPISCLERTAVGQRGPAGWGQRSRRSLRTLSRPIDVHRSTGGEKYQQSVAAAAVLETRSTVQRRLLVELTVKLMRVLPPWCTTAAPTLPASGQAPAVSSNRSTGRDGTRVRRLLCRCAPRHAQSHYNPAAGDCVRSHTVGQRLAAPAATVVVVLPRTHCCSFYIQDNVFTRRKKILSRYLL